MVLLSAGLQNDVFLLTQNPVGFGMFSQQAGSLHYFGRIQPDFAQ